MEHSSHTAKLRRALWLALLSALLPALLCCAPALAEEQPTLAEASGTLELFQAGGLPETERYTARARSADDLDAYVYQQLLQETKRIDISAYDVQIDDIGSVYSAIINNHGDLFFVNNSFNYSYYPGQTKVFAISPSYNCTGEERIAKLAAYNAELSRIVSYASSAATPLGKALLVNDYMVLHYEYDTSYAIYDAYQLFTAKRGVCQAYMLGFRAAMQELGVPCVTAISKSMNHTWNLVQIDGSWYHVDVTWNDPLSDVRGRANHDFFLRSDSGLAQHYGWSAPVSAPNTRFDGAFWQYKRMPIAVLGDTMYLLDAESGWGTRTLQAWRDSGTVCETLLTFWGNGGTAAAWNGMLFYVAEDGLYGLVPGGEPAQLLAQSGMTLKYLSGSTLYYQSSGSWASLDLSTLCRLTLSDGELLLAPGDGKTLLAVTEPGSSPASAVFTSSDTGVCTVDDTGRVQAVAPGTAVVTAQTENGLSASCQVTVLTVLGLPEGTETVAAEAFLGGSFGLVRGGAALTAIGPRAFAGCAALRVVALGSSVTAIAEDAFAACRTDLVFRCPAGSEAARYAAAHGFLVEEAP